MTRLALGALAALVAALSLFASAPAAQAQFRWFDDDGQRQERIYRERRMYDEDPELRRRMRYYNRDAVARRQGQRSREQRVEVERGGSMNFFQRLFGGRSDESVRPDAAEIEVRPRQRKPRRRPPAAIATLPAGAPPFPGQPGDPSAPSDIAAAAVPAEPTTFVAVIGDSVADGLAGGLQEGFADAPELAVNRVTRANAGLVRDDYFDFVAEARKALDAGPINFAVFEIGVNDRQPFLDMRQEPPLSPEWRRRYAARIDALLAPFKEKKVPIYWVGLAPSASGRATADHAEINALARERVEAAGGTYVDVWEGFVDDGGDYSDVGLQLDGQVGRLRLDDGVHFSKAGARKLSHYVEQEIRKVFAPKPATPDAQIAALPADGGASQTGSPIERPRPIASPVVVLTAPQRSASGALSAAAPMTIPARDASANAAKVLVNGETLDASPGRLDDHRWPGAETPKPVAAGASEAAKMLDTATKPAPPPPSALTDPQSMADQRGPLQR